MCCSSVWRSLEVRVKAQIPLLRRQVTVQHLSLPDADLETLLPVFDNIGQRLGLRFELRRDSGDIVLLDVPLASRVSSQLVQAFAEGRPVVLIAGMHSDEEWLLSPGQRLERRRQLLLRQLCDLPLVQARAAGWLGGRWVSRIAAAAHGAPADDGPASVSLMHSLETGVDSRLEPGDSRPQPLDDDGGLELLLAVQGGRRNPTQPKLAASYGPGAHLYFDFQSRSVEMNATANRLLRVHRELPHIAPEMAPAAMGSAAAADIVVRELDETLWDLGIACGRQPLLHEPANWWRTPLRWQAAAPDGSLSRTVVPLSARIARYSRAPRHLELARCLAEGPVTPAMLGRRARIGTSDLRAFLQACLVLDLVTWCPLRGVAE